jgi:endonuclease/exonuclease/phosphatase (EEP) superfamily protein YafD
MSVRSGSNVATGAKTLFGLILLGIGFLATLGTVLGFLGRYWWAFDLLASFRVQYAAVLLVSGVLYGLTMGRVTSLVFLLAAAANIAVIVPFYTDEPAEAAGTDELEVVSFNVAASNVRRSETLKWMVSTGADLGFILESSRDWDPALAELSSGYSVIASVPDDRTFGITAIASDALDVADASVVRLGPSLEPAIRIETAIDGQPVVVYAVHPRSPTTELRAELRDETLAALTDALRRETQPVVVVGDLNTTPWSFTFRALSKEANLIDSMRGSGLQPSWPNRSFLLSIPIDHLLHSDALTTISRETGPDLGSDHRPIEVVLGLAKGD